MTRFEREWVRKLEGDALTDAARDADARFVAMTHAIGVLLADSRAVPMPARHGIDRVALGRSTRLPVNGHAEGPAVLVLAGIARSLLDDTALVRWLSDHHPSVLAALHRASW